MVSVGIVVMAGVVSRLSGIAARHRHATHINLTIMSVVMFKVKESGRVILMVLGIMTVVSIMGSTTVHCITTRWLVWCSAEVKETRGVIV